MKAIIEIIKRIRIKNKKNMNNNIESMIYKNNNKKVVNNESNNKNNSNNNNQIKVTIIFVVVQGALITVTGADEVHLWTLKRKKPELVHSLKFQREKLVYCLTFVYFFYFYWFFYFYCFFLLRFLERVLWSYNFLFSVNFAINISNHCFSFKPVRFLYFKHFYCYSFEYEQNVLLANIQV